MSSHHCLNCSSPVEQNFCAHCGQKASTHRYSIKHFVEHDFVHGVWHVDKGILFTIKELFTRPGHSVREYIGGKRVNYFSFVSLILLIMAVSALLQPYTHIKMADFTSKETRAAMTSFEQFTTKYPKIVLLVAIPVWSALSFLWFRKARLNYSEHLVLNSYAIIPQLLVALLFTAITIFYTNMNVLSVLYVVIMPLFQFVYYTWFYYQFFSVYEYGEGSLLFRSIMVFISYLLITVAIGVIFGIMHHPSH